MKAKLIVLIVSFVSALLLIPRSCYAENSIFTQLSARLRQMQIPFLTRRVSVDCSVNLISRPVTVDDIGFFLRQRFSKIGDDLIVAGDIAKGLGIRLLNYVGENPLDATVIAGSLIAAYLITSSIIHSLTTTRCPCCLRVNHND